VVTAYNEAFFGRGASPVKPAVEDFLTTKVLKGLVPAETKAVDDAGLQYIGTVTIQPERVTIDGNTATFLGCRDGSKAFLVKKGQSSPGVGSSPVGTLDLTVGLVRQDGRWLIDDPRGEDAPSC
jgi:hypothetical protein